MASIISPPKTGLRHRAQAVRQRALPTPAARCRRKFLRFFPEGFHDPKYLEWERNYKWRAHERWQATLERSAFRALLRQRRYAEIAATAVSIESKTNLLFSFEKMALRDATRSDGGAHVFATGLYDFLHGSGSDERRFVRWCSAVAALPRRQTRVLTWPIVTVFGFIAQPERHIFLKPRVTQAAAHAYAFDFRYSPRVDWPTYQSLLAFAGRVYRDVEDLDPRDLIDIQSFLWVQGSDEYED